MANLCSWWRRLRNCHFCIFIYHHFCIIFASTWLMSSYIIIFIHIRIGNNIHIISPFPSALIISYFFNKMLCNTTRLFFFLRIYFIVSCIRLRIFNRCNRWYQLLCILSNLSTINETAFLISLQASSLAVVSITAFTFFNPINCI